LERQSPAEGLRWTLGLVFEKRKKVKPDSKRGDNGLGTTNAKSGEVDANTEQSSTGQSAIPGEKRTRQWKRGEVHKRRAFGNERMITEKKVEGS